MMDRYSAQKIAKLAYRDIRSVIDRWESKNDCDFGIYTHWDGCISVNDEIFHEHELSDNESNEDKTELPNQACSLGHFREGRFRENSEEWTCQKCGALIKKAKINLDN